MNIVPTTLPGVLIFEPKVFGDARGFFLETFRDEWLAQAHIPHGFVQENLSRSCKGVLRGLHYQIRHTQAKLVRVSRGEVFDVAVDVRRGSPTFGQWAGVWLDDVHHRQIYIPAGFAHGFCVLSDEADFQYKCSDIYDAASEAGVCWNDPALGITWPDVGAEWLLSDKDRALPLLAEQSQLPEFTSTS